MNQILLSIGLTVLLAISFHHAFLLRAPLRYWITMLYCAYSTENQVEFNGTIFHRGDRAVFVDERTGEDKTGWVLGYCEETLSNVVPALADSRDSILLYENCGGALKMITVPVLKDIAAYRIKKGIIGSLLA